MTNLEALAIMLVAELELVIASGHNLPTSLIDTIHKFKKAQMQEENRIGADLEEMYKRSIKIFNKKESQ